MVTHFPDLPQGFMAAARFDGPMEYPVEGYVPVGVRVGSIQGCLKDDQACADRSRYRFM